jgi:hypothetical protein
MRRRTPRPSGAGAESRMYQMPPLTPLMSEGPKRVKDGATVRLLVAVGMDTDFDRGLGFGNVAVGSADQAAVGDCRFPPDLRWKPS